MNMQKQQILNLQQNILITKKLKMNQSALKSKFTLWILSDQKKAQQSTQSFGQKLKPAVTFGTIQQFWQFFQYMTKPSKINQNESDIYIFKQGVRPLWEDPSNEKGGYYAFKIQKSKVDKMWQNAVFSLISPLRQVATCINGVRVKIKQDFCILQVWMSAKAHDNLPQLKQYLKDSLQIYDDRYFYFSNFQYLVKGLKGKQSLTNNPTKQENKQTQEQKNNNKTNRQKAQNNNNNNNYKNKSGK